MSEEEFLDNFPELREPETSARPRIWTEDTLQKDAYDPILWDSIKSSSPRVKGLAGAQSEYDVAMSDVYHSLYKSNPTLREQGAPTPKSIMESMMALPEFKNLRAHTRHDDMTSAMGLMKLGPPVVEQIMKIETRLAQEKPKPARTGGDDSAPPLGVPGMPPALDEGTSEGLGTGEAAGGPGEPQEPGLSEEDQLALRQALRAGIKQAQNEVDQWEETCLSWGIKPGDLAVMSVADKLKLADTLHKKPELRKIADLLGRFRNIVHAAEVTAIGHGLDEIVDITQGDDLGRLLPSELAKLRLTPKLFKKDFVEKRLLQYDLKGTNPAGCGPIVVCLDGSQSMEGEREIWAKASTLSLLLLAEKQKRAFSVIIYDSKVQWTKTIDKFPVLLQDKLEIASRALRGGGTDFFPPLKKAFDFVQSQAALKPADIAFITDGECEMGRDELKKVNAWRQDSGARVYGIGIADKSSNNAAVENLEPFCDNISVINSLGDLKHVKGIMTKVASKTGSART